MRMPRCLSVCRNLRLLYPLSPTRRWGRRLGCPRPLRLTAPWFNNCSATAASCRCPGVSTKAINLPSPSTRTCSLVLNPPRLRPNASASALLFLPPLRADGRGSPSHPRSELPNPLCPLRRPDAATQPKSDPRCRPCASAGSGCTRSSTCRIALADPATARPSAQSTASHPAWFDDRSPFDPCAASEAAAAASACLFVC